MLFTAKGTLTYAVLIINIMNFIHSQVFFLIQLLLLFQYAFIKKLLQLFVAIVDAELLEAVVLKIF